MKKKELYLENGYLNMRFIINLPYDFIFIVGARGIGKTYGALRTSVEDDIRFAFVRRTQVQIDIISKQEFSPFKVINSDTGWNIRPASISKYGYGFFDTKYSDEEGKIIIDREKLYGYAFALSTFANMRGFDGCDIDRILWDEFIPQDNEREIKGEASSFFNMIESINRNRELNGINPVKVICMANANDLANPLFVELGIVTKMYNIRSKGEFIYEDKKRSMCVIFPVDSTISEKKKDTALYRLTENSSFYGMAIDNEFYNMPVNNSSKSLIEYTPLVSVGEICIYKHKSKNRLYVSHHKSGSPVEYSCANKHLVLFRKRFQYLGTYAYTGRVDYEDYSCEILFDKYINMMI